MLEFVCLIVYSRLGMFFSYRAAVNLDLCLALMAFGIEGLFTFHTCCDMEPLFKRPHLNRRTGVHVPQRESNRRRKDHQIFTQPL